MHDCKLLISYIALNFFQTTIYIDATILISDVDNLLSSQWVWFHCLTCERPLHCEVNNHEDCCTVSGSLCNSIRGRWCDNPGQARGTFYIHS